MQPSPETAAGNIYDLGYRRYEGTRLGRRQAVLSLYVQSLRAAFGLGRRPAAKVIPVVLVVLALLPAMLQLGLAAATTQKVDIIKPESYYAYVEVLLALFVAAQAPELVGRDQRSGTLPLYFSRAIKRSDYALAKLAALTTAMLTMTLLPEVVLFVGNAYTGTHALTYVKDNWHELGSVLASALLLSAFTASVSLAIAAQTSRRAFAAGAIIALFIFTNAIGSLLVRAGTTLGNRLTVLIALYQDMRGATLWLFNASPGREGAVARADLHGSVYVVALLVVTAVSTWLLLRRYEGYRA